MTPDLTVVPGMMGSPRWQTRTLEVYRLEAGCWLLAATHGGDDVARAEPFGAIELDLARGWLPEDETPGA